MKRLLAASIGAAFVMLLQSPAGAQCAQCNIQTKVPSATVPGKFDYRVSCIIDISGDELNTVVTAATDDEAIAMVRAKC
jgi:hypothetical protein